MAEDRPCIIEGCIRPRGQARGMCSAHYWRWRKYGDPLAGPAFRRIRGTAPKRVPCAEPSGDRRADASYPCDDDMVALMRAHGSYTKVAFACGVRRSSLRDFLLLRPTLRARMDEFAWKPMTEAEKMVAQERHRQQSREWQRAARAADPEGARSRRREQMRKYGPDYRHRWNHYNRLRRKGLTTPDARAVEYAGLIRRDPCVYCGAPCEHIDHVLAIVNGGTGEWHNLAPTCAACNWRKQTRDVLQFMLARLAN